MEDFLTKQNKLDLVDRECRRLKDPDGMIKYDDCVSIIKMILPNSSNMRVKKLLSDANNEGLIEADALNGIVNYLISEENNNDEHDGEDELPDEEQEEERKNDLLQEIFKLGEDGKFDLELLKQLAQKYKVAIGK